MVLTWRATSRIVSQITAYRNVTLKYRRSLSGVGVHLQEITTGELREYIELQYNTIAGVLNVMGEKGCLIRRRRGKQEVLRSRATGGRESGSDGTGVERHGGLGRSRNDRQFPSPGVKEMPSYGCHPFRGGGGDIQG